MFESGFASGDSVKDKFASYEVLEEECEHTIRLHWGHLSPNGAMWDKGNGFCYAIFLATGIDLNSNSHYRTCLFWG